MSLFYLRTQDPQLLGRLLAYNRAHRGVRWLDKRAPKDWWLRFFTIYPGGGWRCRAHDSYDSECALAISFESDPRYADEFGYTTYASVLNTLGVRMFTGNRESGFARSHGFSSDSTLGDAIRERKSQPPEARHIVTGEMLDEAWSDSVAKIHAHRLLAPKHYSRYDRALDDRVDAVLKRLTRPSILSWLRGIGKKILPA